MKLSELLAVLSISTVILVKDHWSEVYMSEAENADAELPERYRCATVCKVYPEYYRGFGKTGLTIVVKP